MNAAERSSEHSEKVEQREALIKKAKELKNKGHSNAAIGRELGLAESSVRSLLKTA